MNTKKPLLSFYSDLLFINSIQSVKNDFISNSTLQKLGYSYIQEYNYYIKDDIIEGNGISPIFTVDIITKEDFFERLTNFETISILKNIELEISQIPEEKDISIYTESLFKEIEILIKRATKIEDIDTNLVKVKLIEIVTFVKDKYSNIVRHHNVFNYLSKDNEITFFKDRDLKYSFYVDLYEMAHTLYLIDDTEIEEIDFINAFTSPHPYLLENKIKFSQNNYIISYFLDSLKPFFYEFSHTKIEQSKVFLNKQSKPFNSNDIYTSLSRGKDKIEVIKDKIDKYILKLKKSHLK